MSAQRQLWCAVLHEAVTDAVHGPTAVQSGTITEKGRTATWQRARDYILRPNRDFLDVCELAGVDPVAVREAVAKQCEDHPITGKLRGKLPAKPARAPKPKPEPARYEHDGLCLTIEEWSARTGIKAATIKDRIGRCWDVARAVTEKPGTTRSTFNPADFGTRTRRAPARRAAPRRTDGDALTLTHMGITRTIREWAEATGLPSDAIRKRVKLGWPDETVLTTPVRAWRKQMELRS